MVSTSHLVATFFFLTLHVSLVVKLELWCGLCVAAAYLLFLNGLCGCVLNGCKEGFWFHTLKKPSTEKTKYVHEIVHHPHDHREHNIRRIIVSMYLQHRSGCVRVCAQAHTKDKSGYGSSIMCFPCSFVCYLNMQGKMFSWSRRHETSPPYLLSLSLSSFSAFLHFDIWLFCGCWLFLLLCCSTYSCLVILFWHEKVLFVARMARRALWLVKLRW